MAVRASWHQPVVDVVDDDPFAAPIEDVGVPIRLNGDVAELAVELVENVKAAQRMREHGTSCPIRDLADTSCSACPVVGVHGDYCANGRRQEQLLTLIAALEVGAGA